MRGRVTRIKQLIRRVERRKTFLKKKRKKWGKLKFQTIQYDLTLFHSFQKSSAFNHSKLGRSLLLNLEKKNWTKILQQCWRHIGIRFIWPQTVSWSIQNPSEAPLTSRSCGYVSARWLIWGLQTPRPLLPPPGNKCRTLSSFSCAKCFQAAWKMCGTSDSTELWHKHIIFKHVSLQFSVHFTGSAEQKLALCLTANYTRGMNL